MGLEHTVYIGECTRIGIGVTGINNINMCNDCKIGVGTVLVENLTEKSTYIGTHVPKVGGGVKNNQFTAYISKWRLLI